MPDSRRLLLELEQTRKQVNRAIINPEIKTLSVEHLEPIVTIVARARAAYVSELFSLARKQSEPPARDTVQHLKELREVFDELVAAANALETMIERGYVDVDGSLSKPG